MEHRAESMRSVVHSAVVRGAEALPVTVEVAVSDGIPGFCIVGMADMSVQESRERVKAALRACGFTVHRKRVIVNLSPSELRKTGSQLDLPIAVGILRATGQIDPASVSGALLVGELSLTGDVLPTRGGLVYALCAKRAGLSLVCARQDGGASHVDGVAHLRIESLSDLRGPKFTSAPSHEPTVSLNELDFSSVPGNESAKRALQVAAAGGHGILLTGAPASPKARLASCLASILPPPTAGEAIEAAAAHSAAGEPVEAILGGARPFRSAHYSISLAGLLAGGSPVRPGEAALAHNGVLLLDELQEFPTSTLQGLRQPAESGEIVIARADGNIRFPAKFLLAATANPCPCGYYGAGEECVCTATELRFYTDRLGGPLRDLLPIIAPVTAATPLEALDHACRTTSSEVLREGVLRAREYAAWRKSREEQIRPTGKCIADSRALSDTARDLLSQVGQNFNFNGSIIERTLAVARTIADMRESEQIESNDVIEAVALRGIL